MAEPDGGGNMQNSHRYGMVFVKGDNGLCAGRDSIMLCKISGEGENAWTARCTP